MLVCRWVCLCLSVSMAHNRLCVGKGVSVSVSVARKHVLKEGGRVRVGVYVVCVSV